MVTFTHCPVCVTEVLQALRIKANGYYIDTTFGCGGHAKEILQKLDENGRLMALDRDMEAVQIGFQMAQNDARFTMFHSRFSKIDEFVTQLGWTEKVNGVLLDLGVSSRQLDDGRRGFSFMNDGPLDMRMDQESGESAAAWLRSVNEEDLISVLRRFGEERFAKRIARNIVENREYAAASTRQLAELVAKAIPKWEKGKNPATRSFQALRIHVNRELDELPEVLHKAVQILAPNGRLVVISFHSLEDRIVKRFIRHQVRGEHFPIGLPVLDCERKPTLKKIGKVIRPGAIEVNNNPRARSAVLRVAEKL